MSAMVERVARALCRFTWETQFGKQDLDACVDQEWPNHTDAARLSIAAMREPNADTLIAGRRGLDRKAMYDRDALLVWQDMIDEILK